MTKTEIEQRRVRLGAERARIHKAIAAANAAPEPKIDTPVPGLVDRLKALLRREAPEAEIVSVEAELANAERTAEQAATADAAARRRRVLRIEALHEQLDPIEQEISQLGDMLDDLASEAADRQFQEGVHALRAAERSLGVAAARVVADNNIRAEVERIGKTGERRRRYKPIRVPDALIELPAIPGTAAYANCPSAFCNVVFGRVSTERPGGNQIIVDFDEIQTERRALFEQR